MSSKRGFNTGPAARSFGHMLRQRRNELGLTLEKVAELAPCSVQHLSELERGERYASLPSVVRIDWALSGSGLLSEWMLELVLEQLSLHHPVYATSRGIMAGMSVGTPRTTRMPTLPPPAGSVPARRCGCGWTAGPARSASSSPTWSWRTRPRPT